MRRAHGHVHAKVGRERRLGEVVVVTAGTSCQCQGLIVKLLVLLIVVADRQGMF